MLGWLGLGRASSATSQVRNRTARSYAIQHIARNRLIIVDAERAAAVSAALRDHVMDASDLDVPDFEDPKNQNCTFKYVIKQGHEAIADEKVRIAAGDPGTPAEELLLRSRQGPKEISLTSQRGAKVREYLYVLGSTGDRQLDAKILAKIGELPGILMDDPKFEAGVKYQFSVTFPGDGIRADQFDELVTTIVLQETDFKFVVTLNPRRS